MPIAITWASRVGVTINSPYCSVVGGQNIAASVAGFLDANPPDITLLHIETNHFDANSLDVNTILDNIEAWTQSPFLLAIHPSVSVFVARIIAVDSSLDVEAFNSNVTGTAVDRPFARIIMVDQRSELMLGGNRRKADPGLMDDNLHTRTPPAMKEWH